MSQLPQASVIKQEMARERKQGLLRGFARRDDGPTIPSSANSRNAPMRIPRSLILAAAILTSAPVAWAQDTPMVAVGPQYDSTHVYVAPEDFDRFIGSVIATFGGTTSKKGVFTVTPTPSLTMSQVVATPVGPLSVFGFTTPIPFPFGVERTGYLVTDMDAAVAAAQADGADVLVSTFPDAIGRDAIIQWPGGVNMQLYWHTTAPNYPALQSIPENRVYVSAQRADAFIHDFLAFSHGTVDLDRASAPGIEIGRPGDVYRRVRISSNFGKLTVFVTDGHLPFPFGRELTGYAVSDLGATLDKAAAAGVKVLVAPYVDEDVPAAIVEFPGGYIAEIHSPAR
jgi:hypothetical protein